MALKSDLAKAFLVVAKNGDAFGRQPLSKVTIRTYEHAIRRAESLLDKPLEDWEYGDMDELFRRAEEAGLRGSTTRSIGNILRIMFRWATEAGIYTKPNPMRGLPQVVREDPPSPVLSPAQADEVLEALAQIMNEKREAASDLALRIPSMDERFVEKYVLIFRFSYYSGIPLKKLMLLKKQDVEEKGVWKTLVYGKRVNREFVPVDSKLMEELRQYVSEHPYTDYVFYGESGLSHGGSHNKPLGTAQSYNFFQQARERAGWGDELTPAAWATSYEQWKTHSS